MCKSSDIINQSRAQPTAIKNGVNNGLSVQPSQNYRLLHSLFRSHMHRETDNLTAECPRAHPHLFKLRFFFPDGKSTSVFVWSSKNLWNVFACSSPGARMWRWDRETREAGGAHALALGQSAFCVYLPVFGLYWRKPREGFSSGEHFLSFGSFTVYSLSLFYINLRSAWEHRTARTVGMLPSAHERREWKDARVCKYADVLCLSQGGEWYFVGDCSKLQWHPAKTNKLAVK